MVCSGECYLCAWQDCIFFCRRVEGSVDAREIYLVDSVIQVLYTLADFLSGCSTHH